MKIVTRTYSSMAHTSGENGSTLAPNGKTGPAVSVTARASAGRSSSPAVDERPLLRFRRVPVTSGWGKALGPVAPGPEALTETARGEFVPVAAGRSEAAAGLPGRVISENEIILFYCFSGHGWCEIQGNRHEIAPGQLFVVPARLERTYATYDGSWSLIWIQLAAINTQACGAKLSATSQTIALGPGDKAQMLALFQDVLHALGMPCLQRQQQVSQRAMALLNRTIPEYAQSRQIESGAASKIGSTIRYMKEHLNEPLRAPTLAAVAKMSLPHYFAQFKRAIGSSPIDYLIKLRMEHARRLLTETSWSVKEVAVSLGYDDPLYFSRVFKSINQTAPSDFRARKRNTNGG